MRQHRPVATTPGQRRTGQAPEETRGGAEQRRGLVVVSFLGPATPGRPHVLLGGVAPRAEPIKAAQGTAPPEQWHGDPRVESGRGRAADSHFRHVAQPLCPRAGTRSLAGGGAVSSRVTHMMTYLAAERRGLSCQAAPATGGALARSSFLCGSGFCCSLFVSASGACAPLGGRRSCREDGERGGPRHPPASAPRGYQPWARAGWGPLWGKEAGGSGSPWGAGRACPLLGLRGGVVTAGGGVGEDRGATPGSGRRLQAPRLFPPGERPQDPPDLLQEVRQAPAPQGDPV